MKISALKTQANIMLLLTAFIWGATFSAQKSAMENIGPFMFNGIRCLLGALSLALISFFIKKDTKYKKRYLIEGGIIAGVFLFVATTMQQLGIVTSTAGKAGFISSLYIVLVPVFSMMLGKKISKSVWIGIIFVLSGLYFLCVNGDFSIGAGDLTILYSTLFFALHIMCISKYSKKTNPIELSCLQFLFAGIFSTVLGLMYETSDLIDLYLCRNEIFCAGILSCAVAFTLQISAQKFVRPHIASLILSFESVFAIIFGYLFLGEILTLKEGFGCLLLFIGVFIARYNKKGYNILHERKF